MNIWSIDGERFDQGRGSPSLIFSVDDIAIDIEDQTVEEEEVNELWISVKCLRLEQLQHEYDNTIPD